MQQLETVNLTRRGCRWQASAPQDEMSPERKLPGFFVLRHWGWMMAEKKSKPTAKVAPVIDLEARHQQICAMVAEGQTIRQIAAYFKVAAGTVLRWATDTNEHAEQYARAREAAADMFETEIIEEALSVTQETANAARVKIDAMKWVAARRAPKKYGDRMTQEITGKDGAPLIPAIDASKLSDAAIAELLAARNEAEAD